ncbi:glucosamine-6-phosphate deaminase [Thermophagus sp. OGC60D27]|uniref:glucosamine-6-phosphate deaminase n=1 Tax=Thermophagus sp. OGC60D27 TaxID=3458415 RepID=UPI0040380DB7
MNTSVVMQEHKEKIATRVFETRVEGSKYVAKAIASLIKEKNKLGKPTVLGLATGSSPLLLYKELIRIHREDGLSFKNVVTFNLDEYYPMDRESKHSYYRFMYENLFSHLDIDPNNVFIPDGTLAMKDLDEYCSAYENKIISMGGIDIQVLGIGRSGHIGFNEPGSLASDETRLVHLNKLTIEDAAMGFGGEENVPRSALTMGIKTILQAKKIFLLGWGEEKAEVIKQAVEGPETTEVPASFLQRHADILFVLDRSAATRLSRIESPWLTGSCEWNERMKKKALIWLSQQVEKPILKLTEKDYKAWGLNSLLETAGSAYDLNIEIHNSLQRTITGWPGGKPGADDKTRPERSEPFPKRVIVFSPHPDDDVISMGGTLLRLSEQGHEVHLAYQTSGNIAVFDDDARRFLDFVSGFSRKFNVAQEEINKIYSELKDYLHKHPEEGNSNSKVLEIKGLIREGEATAACRFCGVKEQNIHFLELPFYETGTIDKKPLSSDDIDIIVKLLREVQPHQIYAAGDLQDPHGTHAVCLNAIFGALDMVKDEEWAKDCYVWLYRGAWQEWDIEDIEMAVPISPDELMKKRKAIFKHQSQKDVPVFPGKDSREFWERAEDRNRATARLYDQLGLTEYEAIEAFRRYHFLDKSKNVAL